MLQRLGIRGKLLAAVAVPTIVLLLAASFLVFNAAATYTDSRNATQLVEVVKSASPVVTALQAERGQVSAYLSAISDRQTDRGNASTNVNRAVAALKVAGVEDTSVAPIADQIAAAVAGANGQEGLDGPRAMAAVDPVDGEFPTWPDATQTQAASDTFERIAQEVAEIAKVLPVSDAGDIARGLPALIRTEGRTTKAYLDDARSSAEALPGLFSTTDSVGAAMVGDAGGIKAISDNEALAGYLANVQTGFQGLSEMRATVRSGTAQYGPAVAAYTDMINGMFAAMSEVANSSGDRTLSDQLKGYVSVAQLVEALRGEEIFAARKIAQGYWRLGEPVQYQQVYFGSNSALANAQAAVALVPGAAPVPDFGGSYDPTTRNGFETIRDVMIDDTTSRALIDQRTNDWSLQVDEEVEQYTPTITQLLSSVTGRAATVVRNSLIQMLATILIAVVVFALTLIITQSIARRIVNPLRRLTTTATAVRQELPRLVERVAMPGQSVDVSEVQIPVESQDEVGRLAEAFNSVNAATLSIAAEQAALRGSISEMFVNVARRDQVLLNRQLASIDEMERTEDNQETLTKLFALDHLATRMRRNSESLLVLAGIDTGRRLRRSMPLSDVIRTASSEIELYERVQLELDADPSMLGHSALTAAHLFAELLENATVFSDPGTQVIVRTMDRDGAFVVSITDSGIGMTQEELAEANSRVASTAASEILGAQRLGLFVVGRIARRVGARVHIDSAEGKGTEATVVMPQSLFDTSEGYTRGHLSATTAEDDLHAPTALVHHDATIEEIDEPVPSPRGQSAYQPTVIERGTDLSERDGDTAVPEPSPLASRVAPTPTPQGLETYDIGSLVAADAAEAPLAVPVDLEELTEGVTEVGLPTRRRRGRVGTEASNDTHSVIALPQRASDAQLSALQSATTSGFTPILAAHEVSPETAEARARVFRGFRPLRGNEDEPVELQPDAESLGHAVRRGVTAADTAPEIDVFAADVAEPALQAEEAPAEPVPALQAEEAPANFEPIDAATDRSFDVMRNYAAEAVDLTDERPHVVRQSPLITTGYVEESPVDAGSSSPDVSLAADMLVPQLEEDDEPAPVVREPVATPDLEEGLERSERSAGVESVSLNDGPLAALPRAAAPYAALNEAPETDANPYSSQLYPAPSGSWRQDAPAEPQFESDPVTSVPSLDELIMDGAGAEHSDYRGGFFSRLFGKGGKAEVPSGQQPTEVPVSPVFARVADSVPAASTPSWTDTGAVPAADTGVVPTADTGVVPTADTGAIPAADTGAIPAADTADARPQAEFSPYAPAQGRAWGEVAPAYERPDEGAGVAPSAPENGAAENGPLGGVSPALQNDAAPQWTMLPPSAFTEPASSAGQTQASFEPEAFEPGAAQGVQDAFASHELGTPYSPDQLASPLGWETAGASALQAAAPEATISYRPVVQITPGGGDSGDGDYASAVFSELSALVAERPKVEKTSAGLQKRTPVAREEPAREPEHPAVQAPRDAEAVRSRFSAFYSGTQRARDDAQNFSDTTRQSPTES